MKQATFQAFAAWIDAPKIQDIASKSKELGIVRCGNAKEDHRLGGSSGGNPEVSFGRTLRL